MAIDNEAMMAPSTTGRVVEIWSLIKRHMFLIIFMGGIGAGLGYVYFLRTPPIYQSTTSLLVRNESKEQSIPFQIQTNEGGGGPQRDQPHALLIVSPLVVQRALDKHLGNGRDEKNEKRTLRNLPGLANLDNPVHHIMANLNNKPGNLRSGPERTDIVNLSYRDSDALTTKAVLDALVASYQDFLGENHKNVSLEVLELIEHAQTTLLKHIEEVTTEYTQFRHETPLLFSGDTKATNVHKERMSEIEAARSKLSILITERRAELQSIKDALARGGNREAIAIMIQSMKPDARSAESGIKTIGGEIFPLLLKEQLLLQDLGPEHPKVRQLQKEIELTENFHMNENPEGDRAIRRKRGDFLSICIDAFQHEVSSIESKIIELDQLFESERQWARSILAFEVKNEYYRKELERSEKLYESVVKRLDELNLLQDYGGYKTAVISPAHAGIRVAPVLSQSLLIGAICGAAIGFGIGYLVEANDKTYRSPEEVSEHLGLPIVGHIPVIAREVTRVTTGSKLDKTLVAYFKPKSRTSESYRAIRTSLYFSTRGDKHKLIQITSPNPGDGKTTLSANLCISIAQSGKKILLIDADFRRPRIHELFVLDKSIGISSVISGETELPDAIQSTEVENLWCLPCGPRPNNPCELLSSRRFEELLNILREQYDFVIIDTPPLLAVTDPSAVAARVDGVLLTIRLSKRTRGEASRSTELLATVGANTLGVVVNGVGKSSRYGYEGYGGYGGYVGYGGYGGYAGYGGYGDHEYHDNDRAGSHDDIAYVEDDNPQVGNREVAPVSKQRSRGFRRDV